MKLFSRMLVFSIFVGLVGLGKVLFFCFIVNIIMFREKKLVRLSNF